MLSTHDLKICVCACFVQLQAECVKTDWHWQVDIFAEHVHLPLLGVEKMISFEDTQFQSHICAILT